MANVAPALIVGPNTFCGTNVFVGQGNFPLVRCRISFDDVSDPTPTWVEVPDNKFRSFATSRGRESEFQQFDAGTATVVLDNRDRAYDPTLHSEVRPMNRLWLFEEFSGEVHDLFKGYVNSWDQGWPGWGGSDADVTINAADEFQRLALDTLPSSGTLATSPSSTQISNLLDLSDSRSAPRLMFPNLGAGIGVVAAPLTGQTPAAQIQATLPAVLPDGGFFTSASGTLTLLVEFHRTYPPYDTSQANFGDAGGSELPYVDVNVDYSESFLVNDVIVNTPSVGSYATSAAASIARYGKRTATYEVPAQFAGSLPNIGDQILAAYKDPMLRVASLTLTTSEPDVAEAALRRDLMDRITVKRTPPGGGARISEVLFIQKIEVAGANDGKPWTIRWAVSPL